MVVKSYAKTQGQKKRLEVWKPRDITPGIDCPASGTPEEFEDDSPEKELAQFFQYWANNNYGKMATLIKTFIDYPLSKRAGEVRQSFQGKSLEGYKFLEIQDHAAAITEISTEVNLTYQEKNLTEILNIRMLHEDKDGNPELRGEPDGNWLIIEHSFMPIYRMI